MARTGALVGPPWAKRENGFLFSEAGGISLYYEPHCDYDESSLAGIASVDMVITPVVNQELLSFPLVCWRSLLGKAKPRVALHELSMCYIRLLPAHSLGCK